MTLAILFALLSLLFAGVNDVVFRRYSVKKRPAGEYVCGIGIVWTALQLMAFRMQGVSIEWDQNTLVYGLAAGALLTISNILLIESLSHIDVGLGSTIYRLNTIGVVAFSVMFLAESQGLEKILGIVIGIVGVLLLYQRQGGSLHDRLFALFFSLAVVASVFRAAYAVSAKVGLLQGADANSMLLMFASSWILGGACYAGFRDRRFRFSTKTILYSLLSGVLVFAIVNALMLAMNRGDASLVIPVANLSFVVALVLSAVLKMEKLTARKLCALGCAVSSIVLLASGG